MAVLAGNIAAKALYALYITNKMERNTVKVYALYGW